MTGLILTNKTVHENTQTSNNQKADNAKYGKIKLYTLAWISRQGVVLKSGMNPDMFVTNYRFILPQLLYPVLL